MDAITKKKTLTGVLVALLVGTVFATGFMNEAAAQPNPSGSGVPVAAVDTQTPVILSFNYPSGSWTSQYQPVIVPTSGKLIYNTSYDLTFTNISNAANIGYGYATQTTGLRLCDPNAFAVGNPRDLYADGAHAGMFNVTFPSFVLNATGNWTLQSSATVNGNGFCTGGTVVATFFAYPVTDVTVTLSQNSFVYQTGNVSFTISVVGLATGQTANLVGIGIPAGTTVTAASPNYVFFGPLPEVGTFFANASVNTGGDALPERSGSTTYTVTAAALTVKPVDITPRAGFLGTASYNVTFPNGKAPILNTGVGSDGRNNTVWYNFSVALPGSLGILYFNGSSGTPTICANTTCTAPSGLLAGASLTFDAFGNLSFTPSTAATGWPAGSYTFTENVNTTGAPTGDAYSVFPEYTATWTFTPSTPASVNVDFFANNVTATNLTVLEAVSAANGPPGAYFVTIRVTGPCQAEHPSASTLASTRTAYCAIADTTGDGFSFANNVSITGDVIQLFGTGAYNPATGNVTVGGIVPTKGGGSVTIAVTWKGTTTSITLPIVHGARLSASPAELLVDKTSAITFTLTDIFGNPVPDGKVFLFQKPSGDATATLVGATSVNGTGAPGAGQNGQYTINLAPNTVQDYIAYGIIGRQESSSLCNPTCDFRNFTYTTFRVVPAHDVVTTLTPATAMGGVPTTFSLNATLPTGANIGNAAAVKIYILNAAQVASFAANGTSALPTTATATTQSNNAGLVGGVATYLSPTSTVLGYNWTSTLEPGFYWVYIATTDQKHDNNGTLANLTVYAFQATFSPDKIADNANIQANTTVMVTVKDVAGKLVNGTLNVSVGESTGFLDSANQTSGNLTTTAITITNGLGWMNVTGKNAGNVNWQFKTTDAGALPEITQGSLLVVGANVTVTPNRVPVGKTSTILISVKSLNGTALGNLSVQMCGVPLAQGCTEAKLTDANGLAQVGVFPTVTGNLTMRISGVNTTTNVTVFAGLDILATPSSPTAGDSVTLQIVQVGQAAGESGVTVAVTKGGAAVSGFPQTTGSDGKVVLSNVAEGAYVITATKAGLDPGQLTLTVGAKQNQSAAHFVLSNLVAPSTGTVGTPLDVTADLSNTGTADGTASASLIVNGVNVASRTVAVAAGATEHLGYTFTPTKAGVFNVTVRLADGTTIASQTVTIATPTGTTTTTTTTSSSTTTTTSTPTTSTTTTTTTTPAPTKVPGFEVVALLGALAVAMLVLRRRN